MEAHYRRHLSPALKVLILVPVPVLLLFAGLLASSGEGNGDPVFGTVILA